jgi:7-cyano-7-deazaguanine reductase
MNKHGSSDTLTLLGQSRTEYPSRPEDAILETIPWNGTDGTIVELHCPEFTCCCPKTGQPDFATIVIEYAPGALLIESKALKLYLFSFRNVGIFHEVGVERICCDLFAALQPRWITVRGDYLPRGGISIRPTCTMGTRG